MTLAIRVARLVACCGIVSSAASAGQSPCPPGSVILERPFSQGGELLGSALATSGSTLAAAAPGLGGQGFLRGGVLVWRRNTTTNEWVFDGELRAPIQFSPSAPSQFGKSIACWGDRVVVGNPSDVNSRGQVVGAIYVYRRGLSGGWSIEQRLLNPAAGVSSGEFGRAVAIEGDRIIAGPTVTTGVGPPQAAAYFRMSATNGQWEFREFIAPQNSLFPWANDFAVSIAMSQNRVVIGAPLEQPVAGSYNGAAHVYALNASDHYAPLVRINGPAPSTAAPFGDRFAAAIAFDGGTVLAGAPDAMTGSVRTGAAYAYVQAALPTEPWLLASTLHPSDLLHPSGFGVSVEMRGTWAVVGAPQAQLLYEYGSFTGCAELFTHSGASWQSLGRRTTFRPGPVGGDPQRAVGAAVSIVLDSTGQPSLALGAPESMGGLDNAGTVDLLPIVATIADCNDNALPDVCEIGLGIAQDLNFNRVPDRCCPADIDGNTRITIEDVFAFLIRYFGQRPEADINRIGGVTVQDVFDFLDSYFRGCT